MKTAILLGNKKIKLINIILLIFISSIINAQTVEWILGCGSKFNDISRIVKCDPAGNIYVAGYFPDTVDFDPGPGTYNLISEGLVDVFICKFNPGGDLIWAKQLGGNSKELCSSMYVDELGNVYTTGEFGNDVDFDPGPGIFIINPPNGGALFISKLDSAGNFVWAKSIGEASNEETAGGICTDALGNVYINGTFEGTVDFNPGIATYFITSTYYSGNQFILKLDSFGNFIWAKSTTGSYSQGNSISTDSNGNVCFIGSFQDTVDFNPGIGTFNLISNGLLDIFVCKWDSNGQFQWAKSIGGLEYDYCMTILNDEAGNIFICGKFKDVVDFDPGPGIYNIASLGLYDAFMLKLDENGNFLWAKSIGGVSEQTGNSIALDVDTSLYLTGYFQNNVDFDPGPGTFYLNSFASGSGDGFLLKLNNTGNFEWAKMMGGSTDDIANSVSVDLNKNVFVTGTFNHTADFDPPAQLNLTSNGGMDIFIVKYNQNPTSIPESFHNDISIYPNPGAGRITIDFGEKYFSGDVFLVNNIGQLIFQGAYTEQPFLNIELGDSCGMYFLKIITDAGTFVFKVTKY